MSDAKANCSKCGAPLTLALLDGHPVAYEPYGYGDLILTGDPPRLERVRFPIRFGLHKFSFTAPRSDLFVVHHSVCGLKPRAITSNPEKSHV